MLGTALPDPEHRLRPHLFISVGMLGSLNEQLQENATLPQLGVSGSEPAAFPKPGLSVTPPHSHLALAPAGRA